MDKQYLDYDGLERVSETVNTKLKKVTTFPNSPSDGETVIYIGETGANGITGYVYTYNAAQSKWIPKFFAPKDSGIEGQVLKSKGPGKSPEWGKGGYNPTVVGNSICFLDGVIPKVEGNTLVFTIEGG